MGYELSRSERSHESVGIHEDVECDTGDDCPDDDAANPLIAGH